VQLPDPLPEKLGLADKTPLAFIERKGAVAIKKVEVAEREGKAACILDLETPYLLTRVLETNPPPEAALAAIEPSASFRLPHSVQAFWEGKETLHGWLARRLLGTGQPGDESFRKSLVCERTGRQDEDGSWKGSLPLTVCALSELEALGVPRSNRSVKHGVDWLLARPESERHPGLFALRDRYTEKDTTKQRGTGDLKLFQSGDPLLCDPCGPRVIGATALALEVLLRLGCARRERVRRALSTLRHCHWCESEICVLYRQMRELSDEDLERSLADAQAEYKYGGLAGPQDLLKEKGPRRIRQSRQGVATQHVREMPMVGGCGVVTARALSCVSDRIIGKRLAAFLLHTAARQDPEDGRIKVNYPAFWGDQAGFIELFSRFKLPVARLGIHRLLPWVIANQNKDGSWGEPPNKEAATLGVLRGLKSVGLV